MFVYGPHVIPRLGARQGWSPILGPPILCLSSFVLNWDVGTHLAANASRASCQPWRDTHFQLGTGGGWRPRWPLSQTWPKVKGFGPKSKKIPSAMGEHFQPFLADPHRGVRVRSKKPPSHSKKRIALGGGGHTSSNGIILSPHNPKGIVDVVFLGSEPYSPRQPSNQTMRMKVNGN